MFNLKSLTTCSCSAVILRNEAVSSIKVCNCDNLYRSKNHFCVDIHIHVGVYPPLALARGSIVVALLSLYYVLLCKLLLLLDFYTDTSSIYYKKVCYLCNILVMWSQIKEGCTNHIPLLWSQISIPHNTIYILIIEQIRNKQS